MTLLSDTGKQQVIDSILASVRPLDSNDAIIITATAFFNVWQKTCIVNGQNKEQMIDGLQGLFEVYLSENLIEGLKFQ